MAETYNIGEIATRVSEDIFEYFRWNIHPATNHNFACLNVITPVLLLGIPSRHSNMWVNFR